MPSAVAPGFGCANTFVGANTARATNAPAAATAVAPLRTRRRVIIVIVSSDPGLACLVQVFFEIQFQSHQRDHLAPVDP
jgi:hypothetical protein